MFQNEKNISFNEPGDSLLVSTPLGHGLLLIFDWQLSQQEDRHLKLSDKITKTSIKRQVTFTRCIQGHLLFKFICSWYNVLVKKKALEYIIERGNILYKWDCSFHIWHMIKMATKERSLNWLFHVKNVYGF